MSTTFKRSTNVHGEKVLTITVVGAHDVYRLCWNLMNAQVEFAEGALKTFRWLRRGMGAKQFDAMDQRMSHGRVKRYLFATRRRQP